MKREGRKHIVKKGASAHEFAIFLQEMEKKQGIVHVKERVSPRFEVSSIIKAFDQNGSILSFGRVANSETTKMGVDATRPLGKKREKFELAKIPTGVRVQGIVKEPCKKP